MHSMPINGERKFSAMAIQLESYGNAGKFLISRGWKIEGQSKSIGTACADAQNRTIWMRPSAFSRPNLRVRKYVVPHEIWHAVHWELNGWNVASLQADRGLRVSGALEAVADGACILMNPSRTMRAWVRASVAWHGKVGYKYSWADVCSQQVKDVYLAMKALVDEGQ